MRYIMTEDGIIDRDSASPHMVVDGYIDFNSQGRFKIMKQADSIEELCDAFVGVSKLDKSQHYFMTRKVYKPSLEMDVYGAIWTDKGLIYVAKMNGEGKFELL